MSSNLLNPKTITAPIKREYINLRGVDFMNDASRVSLNRSPEAMNVYKDYTENGECIQTRPGHRVLGNFSERVLGIFFFENKRGLIVLIHSGTKLYKWRNYPENKAENFEVLFSEMNTEIKSVFLVFNNILYILDGKNYLYYDGEKIAPVKEIATIPTTTISREPRGGGTEYQPINVLQSRRKNQFVSDGVSTEYALDATDIDESTVRVWINSTELIENTDFTVNRVIGTIKFNTAPEKSVLGNDNVIIEFSKTIEGYYDRIEKCSLGTVFDNRIFFSGNKTYNNAIFHCKLDNPTYISDLDYYQDGLDNSNIKSMCVGNNLLWVFKESNQQNNTIFYHTPTLDNTNGRIYPSAQGNISLGCYSESINFNDDIVFITQLGLEGIAGNIESEQVLNHRSTLVDAKMVNLENFDKSSLTEWQGYLIVLVNGKMFLADSRQVFQSIKGTEYEWYFWDGISTKGNKVCLLREYKGNLLLGFENGDVAILEGTNDNGRILESYWTTPRDLFGSENHYKITNKRGGIIKLKTIPNSKVKIATRTNKSDTYKYIKEYSMTGFDYGNLDYTNWDYASINKNYLVVKIKEKKIIDLSVKIYSDEKDRPFGLYGLIIESYLGGYIKR